MLADFSGGGGGVEKHAFSFVILFRVLSLPTPPLFYFVYIRAPAKTQPNGCPPPQCRVDIGNCFNMDFLNNYACGLEVITSPPFFFFF